MRIDAVRTAVLDSGDYVGPSINRTEDDMSATALNDLLHLKFTRRKLHGSELRTMEAFHRLFRDQLWDIEAEEAHILRKLGEIEKMRAAIVTPDDGQGVGK